MEEKDNDEPRRPNNPLRHLDLFSGIGGFALGLSWAGGFETVAFCDNEPFAQEILKKRWPNVPIYEDVRTINEKELGKIDIITGGFPCQPWSLAGSRKGADDDRDLWPEMVAIIENLQPKWVIGENVRGFVNEPLGLQRTLSDLESIGYQAIPYIIPASGVGAFHRRERVWIIANPRGDGKPIVRRESRELKQPEQISLF
tara:strand:- start:292 stop:891 length:600 start_codon:yes stop_codon:yes gene_type:complete